MKEIVEEVAEYIEDMEKMASVVEDLMADLLILIEKLELLHDKLSDMKGEEVSHDQKENHIR